MRFWPVVVLLVAMVLMAPAATSRDADPSELLAGDARSIAGGAVAAQATPIEAGVTYTDAVADEQQRWYSVPVERGEPVDVAMAEDGSPEYGCCVELRLYAPDQRTDFGREGGYGEGVAKVYRTGTGGEGARQSGTFYVSVELDDLGPLDREVDYQLNVDVGDAVSGQAGADSGEAAVQESPGQDDGDTRAQGEGEASSEAGDDSVGTLLTLLIVMGALVLALGATVIVLLVRLGRQ